MVDLHIIDIVIILGYFLAVTFLALKLKGKIKGVEDYLLMGRKVTLPLFVGTLVSTWYGGILGVGEISYNSGIVNWVTQGFFWYLSYIVFALILSERLRRSAKVTLPDQLDNYYGRGARALGTLFNFLNVIPIVYILSLGLIIKVVFGIPLWQGIVFGSLISIVYTVIAGFYSDVYTDFLQFIIMCTMIPLILIFSVFTFGGYEFLAERLPQSHFSAIGDFTIGEVIVWGFLAMGTLVDPNFYQRCYAAEKPRIARSGIFLSIGFWLFFDICTTFIGMYARAAMPSLVDAKLSFPLYADAILPIGLKGLFFVGLIATVMSTIDSYCLVGGMTISHDFYRKLLGKERSQEHLIFVSRLGVVMTCVLAMGLALIYNASIKSIWYVVGSITFSALFFPMLAGMFIVKEGKSPAGLPSMIAGVTGAVSWFIVQKMQLLPSISGFVNLFEPLYVGLVLSILGFFLFHRGAVEKKGRLS